MAIVTKLRCEYLENPIGLDNPHPRISWQIQSGIRSWLQSAFQIQVSPSPDFSSLLWDSGKVQSNESTHIALTELDVEASRRYYYHIRVWDKQELASAWSEIAFWETGLLEPGNWQAQWISAPLQSFPVESGQSPLLRRIFSVNAPVRSARIYVTALGLYELNLNGIRVGEDYFTPGWTNYNKRLQYQTYDVTALLSNGSNAIGAALGNGWFKGNLAWEDKKNIYGERTALLLELHVTYEDGSGDVIVSDNGWRAAKSPVLLSEIYHGETYDARLEKQGWSTAAYDDSQWEQVEVLEHTKAILIAQENEPVRKIGELQPIALLTTPAGETVIDMGQNMVGWVRFTMNGAEGQEVSLQHAEVLDQEGNFYTENLRNAKQAIHYILNGQGSETYEPHFTFQGFRYVKLTGFSEPVRLEDFTGVVLHSDMEVTGDFQCSDPLINQLQHNILWGQKGNFLDVPTDCPQRDERLGWTGDAQMFIRTSAHLMNVAPFFGKWLKDLASDQLENGGVPFVIPNVLGDEAHSSAAWGDAAVICPWVIYQCYGDKRILEQQYESMKAWVDYMHRQGEQEFLWNTGFHFGDWLGLDSKPGSYIGATDRDLIATAFFAYSTSLFVKTAAVLEKKEDIAFYSNLHDEILKAFKHEFITPSGRLSVPTQTAQVLALMFGLVEGKAKERAEKKLLELMDESKHHLTTGFVGTPYLNLVLSQIGSKDAAYKLLFQTDYPSWLYQVTKGATTIWEHWDGIKEDGSFWSKDMNSFNHYAYGAIGDWLYRCVAGIDTDEAAPGYKHILIKPQPGEGLTWAKATLQTLHGLVASEWRHREDSTMELHVTIPPNTTASILLPEAVEEGILENGKDIALSDGIHSMSHIDSGAALEIGSGDYVFTFSVPVPVQAG
ncbi:glycoside hydrolase family 78 protein [Paenibacillus nasutitermitis]|uniref:alpha-L-rhamnosidase n=1 Tax=Paenibacillus nasutitermitis TaxID=1652958 RepID=A0A916Z4W1_9BACL|nr:glycoside hydrolase family 78 protein [Paenibacillus nasutitermitis]GGD76875.1 alfa-L-rhamnosidase [Paenibacillus nasutitermitis]